MKEMEKMKNKREEKRAQNSEIRIKRAQVTWAGDVGGFRTGALTDKQSPRLALTDADWPVGSLLVPRCSALAGHTCLLSRPSAVITEWDLWQWRLLSQVAALRNPILLPPKMCKAALSLVRAYAPNRPACRTLCRASQTGARARRSLAVEL